MNTQPATTLAAVPAPVPDHIEVDLRNGCLTVKMHGDDVSMSRDFGPAIGTEEALRITLDSWRTVTRSAFAVGAR